MQYSFLSLILFTFGGTDSRKVSEFLWSSSILTHSVTVKMASVIAMHVACAATLITVFHCPIVVASSNTNFQLFRNCMEEQGVPSTLLIEKANLLFYSKLNKYQYNKNFNKRYPLAYLVPKTTSHVQSAVRCGSKVNIPLVPKSGGHSYEAHSSGNSSTIIIDFRNMDRVTIDPSTKTAVIQPGALVGPTDLKLWVNGGFAIPTGRCIRVGMGGHALGGGVGYFAYLYGLTLDNVLEMTMVDASGKANLANANMNPDLYWALRGVGPGAIGIVTRFKFKLHKVDHFSFNLVELVYHRKHFIKVFLAWQKWITTTQIQTKSFVYFVYFGSEIKGLYRDGMGLRFLYSISKQDSNIEKKVNDFLALVLKQFPKDLMDSSLRRDMSYWELKEYIGYPQIHYDPLTGVELYTKAVKYIQLRFYHKSFSFYVNQTFTKNQMQQLEDIAMKLPKFAGLFFNSNTVGPFPKIPINATAFAHRNALYHLSAATTTMDKTDFKEGVKWSRNFIKVSKFMDNGETYQNFPNIEWENYLERYYGANLNELVRIKRKWDPTNYFSNTQSLPVEL